MRFLAALPFRLIAAVAGVICVTILAIALGFVLVAEWIAE